jgi:hypothetical protein
LADLCLFSSLVCLCLVCRCLVVASLPSNCPVVFLFFSSCLASFSGPYSTLSCVPIPVSLFLWLVTSCPLFVAMTVCLMCVFMS